MGSEFLKRDLLSRGWSKTAIDRILGAPDRTSRRRGGGHYCHYSADRVVAAEQMHQDWRRSDARSQAGKVAAERRANALEASIAALNIELPKLSGTELLDAAIAAHNAWNSDSNCLGASHSSDPEFLERIQVNYLRHECSRYDVELGRIAGQVGRDRAHETLRDLVYNAISDAYPQLATECWRQQQRREASSGC